MKKLIVCAFLVLLVLSGCSLLAPENPIVGTWETTILGATTNYVFNTDGTSIGTTTVLDVGISTYGIWSSDSTKLTITWAGSSEDEVELYSFNGDKSTMTLSPTAGGLSRTFARQ
ncbi:MAG: hypothetical protein WAZ99_05225 [Rectinemataceae bacterium]